MLQCLLLIPFRPPRRLSGVIRREAILIPSEAIILVSVGPSLRRRKKRTTTESGSTLSFNRGDTHCYNASTSSSPVPTGIECCHPTSEWLITKAMHDSSHPNRNPTKFLFHRLRNSCIRKDDRRRLSLTWNQERCSRFCVCTEKRNKSAEISRICLQLCRRRSLCCNVYVVLLNNK